MKVTLFQRNQPTGYSIENITKNIVLHLPKEAEARIFVSSFLSRGLINRIKAAWEVRYQQGEVNHIMGDIHFLTFFLSKRKTILTICDCERLVSDNYHYIRKLLYKYFWFTLPALRSARITTISNVSKQSVVHYAGIDENQILVIPIGVDDCFRTLHLSQEEKKKLLHNDLNKKTVMHISDTRANKNVPRLIEAIMGLDVKFIKIGKLSGKDIELLDRHKIDYLNYENIDIDLLVKVYNSVDCLAFPSLLEGFGMPVVEAQRCECPVITSNTSSLPEVAGAGAVLVDPYSVESIRDGIRRVLGNKSLRDDLIQKGLENARRFDWNVIAMQYCELYKMIVRESKAP